MWHSSVAMGRGLDAWAKKPEKSQEALALEVDREPFTAFLPVGGRLLASALYYGPARAYCGPSPAWEFLEDPFPRLVLFLICPQALLVYRFPWNIHSCAEILLCFTRTRVIVAAEIRIAVAQTTIVIVA